MISGNREVRGAFPTVAKRWDMVRWGIVTIRVFLAAVFILYGTCKLIGLQFGVGELITHMRLFEVSPYMITWYFFDLSPLYRDSIGIAQIIVGLLLVFSRTAPVGALCFFVIILNIVLINFGYNIATDVKILSSVLLVLNCILSRHYWRRYLLLLLPEEALDKILNSRNEAEGINSGLDTGHKAPGI